MNDQSECIVLERYKDSEALIQHAANVGGLIEAILATGSVSGELLGEPSADLQAQLAGGPVRLFTPSNRCNHRGPTRPGCHHPAA